MKDFCTLRRVIARNLEYNPEKTAVIEGQRQYTFREFADRTRSMGNALLNLGLEKRDRVAILSKTVSKMPNPISASPMQVWFW